MLRDRLVCGINDARIQRRLLSTVDLNLKKALETAQAMETAERDSKDSLQQGLGSHELHKLTTGGT